MIGKTLAHYELVSLLGRGGMGEVYRARDTRLHREVAIKIVPPALVKDEATRSRFEREARLLASLNHPHIGAIHGLEHDGGQDFLVLELIDGSDLGQRLEQGPLALDETIRIARQLTEALAAAHRQGVIHRDLKPSNIALTSDGSVKILDFGLAKALGPDEEQSGLPPSQSPTVLGGITASNVILGTAGYMSPEQARGGSIDPRTDIWALGCVVYECLCGRRAFDGASISETLASVLRDPVDFTLLPSRTPPTLRRLLMRFLERAPERRMQSLADVAIELDEAERELREGVFEAPTAESPRGRTLRWLGWTVAAVLAVLLGISWFRGGESPRPQPVVRFTISADSLSVSPSFAPVISPDGRRLAYVAGSQLWVREFSQLEARALPGTAQARAPFWAPDSENLAFQRDRQLWRMNIHSGSPVVICEIEGVIGDSGKGAWTEDGRVIFGTGNGPIFEAPSDGGQARVLVAIETEQDDDFHTPSALPGGRGLLFVPHFLSGGAHTIQLFRGGERSSLWELPARNTVSRPIWDSSGFVLFVREDQQAGIWALPFSLERLRVTGDAFPVAMNGSLPSVSDDGTLIYVMDPDTGHHQLVRVSLDGSVESMTLDAGNHVDDETYSPSGAQLLYTIIEGGFHSVVVNDLERGTRTVVARGLNNLNPFWISESQVGILKTDSMSMVLHDLEVASEPRVLFRAPKGMIFQRISTSPSVVGQILVFTLQENAENSDIWVATVGDPENARPLLNSPHRERAPQISPDGRLLAWVSEESGESQVYLARLEPDGSLQPRRWQVSSEGGISPRWSRDGKRLFYGTGVDVREVEVRAEDGITLGRPRRLFELGALGVELDHGYGVTPDGTGFVMTQVGGAGGGSREIVVVENWASGFLDRRVE